MDLILHTNCGCVTLRPGHGGGLVTYVIAADMIRQRAQEAITLEVLKIHRGIFAVA